MVALGSEGVGESNSSGESMVVFVVMYACHCQSVGGKAYQVLSRHCRKCVGGGTKSCMVTVHVVR